MNRVRVYGGWVQIFRVKMMKESCLKILQWISLSFIVMRTKKKAPCEFGSFKEKIYHKL